MERHIVHCDLDSFYVSVARLQNPALKGKPVLIGGNSDRAVVASCSYEARQFGIHSAMPMRLAKRLCPEAEIVKGDYDEYARRSKEVTDIIADRAPLVEKASIDEHYIDISGMDKYFGCWQWTKELRQAIMKETHLPISFGLSSSKTVSKIATGQSKPNGEKLVEQGGEKTFLAPLSIKTIPMIGNTTYTRLRNMGISRINTLQQVRPELLQRVLGDNGISIWKKANGIDDSAVIPFSERKSLSKENTFSNDTIDMDLLRRHMLQMVDELAFDLRSEGKLTGCITLKIRYSNFETVTKQVRLPYTCSDRLLTEKVLDLFQRLYSRRMLIRLIGVKFSELVAGSYQIDLFNDAVTDLNLSQAMDGIRRRFGTQSVTKAILL
jgi:DNA polymerase IV